MAVALEKEAAALERPLLKASRAPRPPPRPLRSRADLAGGLQLNGERGRGERERERRGSKGSVARL